MVLHRSIDKGIELGNHFFNQHLGHHYFFGHALIHLYDAGIQKGQVGIHTLEPRVIILYGFKGLQARAAGQRGKIQMQRLDLHEGKQFERGHVIHGRSNTGNGIVQSFTLDVTIPFHHTQAHPL